MAGVAGLTVAVGAAQLGLRSALIGPRTPVHRADADAPFDARIYAIAPASVALLEQLKVWPAVDAARVQPVARMRVFGDAGNERGLGADDHEIGVDGRRQVGSDAHGMTVTTARPCDGGLAAARTDDQHPHASTPSNDSFGGASSTGIG